MKSVTLILTLLTLLAALMPDARAQLQDHPGNHTSWEGIIRERFKPGFDAQAQFDAEQAEYLKVKAAFAPPAARNARHTLFANIFEERAILRHGQPNQVYSVKQAGIYRTARTPRGLVEARVLDLLLAPAGLPQNFEDMMARDMKWAFLFGAGLQDIYLVNFELEHPVTLKRERRLGYAGEYRFTDPNYGYPTGVDVLIYLPFVGLTEEHGNAPWAFWQAIQGDGQAMVRGGSGSKNPGNATPSPGGDTAPLGDGCDEVALADCLQAADAQYQDCMNQAESNYDACLARVDKIAKKDGILSGITAFGDTMSIFLRPLAKKFLGAISKHLDGGGSGWDMIEETYERIFQMLDDCKSIYESALCTCHVQMAEAVIHCFHDFCRVLEDEITIIVNQMVDQLCN